MKGSDYMSKIRDLFIPYGVASDKKLNGREKIALSILLVDQNITNEELAYEIALCPKSALRVISNLKRKGYIEVAYTYKTGAKGIDKRYIYPTEKTIERINKYAG